MDYFEPELDNPYPAEWLGREECADFEMTVVDFEYHTPLILYRGIESVRQRTDSDAEYVVGADYKVSFRLDTVDREEFGDDDEFEDNGDAVSRDDIDLPAGRYEITVPKGMLTDLTSVPSVVRGIIGRVGPHLEAAIVHDFLYVAWQDVEGLEAREKDREFSDKLMRAAMASANVGSFQRRAIYDAVAEFGRSAYVGRNQYRYVEIP
ncbi:MAG: hypothetical protein CMM48_13675 [Rhodospirillaceae bacterium]|nr:hypothetical protein [Rhodospirillaceae bacterium]